MFSKIESFVDVGIGMKVSMCCVRDKVKCVELEKDVEGSRSCLCFVVEKGGRVLILSMS